MGINKNIPSRLSRNSPRASTSLLGLAAGAVSWSGLAQAASEKTGSQIMLLPENYELMDKGVAVLKLETGENLSLTSDQYVILEDGLLLVIDELAQASMYSLPLVGSVRAQFLSDQEQVAALDGPVAEATPAQALSITQGQAPQLSEQVELQTFELAQTTETSSNEETTAALATGATLVGGLALVLLGSSSGSGSAQVSTSSPTPSLPANFLTSAQVPGFQSFTINGTNGDDFIGYADASTSNPDPLDDLARDYNSVSFSLADGNNYLDASDGDAAFEGIVTYTGGSDKDEITIGDEAADDGIISLNALDGHNSLIAGYYFGYDGVVAYRGGDDQDKITLAESSAYEDGTVVLYLGDGNNTVNAPGTVGYTGDVVIIGGDGADALTFTGDDHAYGDGSSVVLVLGDGSNSLNVGNDAASAGSIVYMGGDGSDTITAGTNFCYEGYILLQMGDGSNSLQVGAGAAVYERSMLLYHGGTGADTITLGDGIGMYSGDPDHRPHIVFDLGLDDTSDSIEFEGKVGEGSTLRIHNFNPAQDSLTLGSLTATAQVTMTTTANGIRVTSAGEVDLYFVGPTSTAGFDLSVDGSGDVVIA